ncbi:hypothetical protein MMPV_009362 [Pyropia vietnamensis]
MADGGPPAGDMLERLRHLGRALDAMGGWVRIPPPALARARELFADAAAWREFYTHPESEDDGDSSFGSGDETPLWPPPSAPAGSDREPPTAPDAALVHATGSASGVRQAASAAAVAGAAPKPFPLRIVLQRELTLRSIQAGLAIEGGEVATGVVVAAAAGGPPRSSSVGGSGSSRPRDDRPPAGPARVPLVSDVFQSVEAAPAHRPSPYVDDEIDVSDVVASRPDSPVGGAAPTSALPPLPPAYILMDGSSERFFGHGADSPSGNSDASDGANDEDGSDFSSSTDGDDSFAPARAGELSASPHRSWDDPDRLAALACRLCALRSRLLPPEPPLSSVSRRGGVANGNGQAAKRRRRTGRRRPGGSDAEGSSTKRPRTAAAAAVPDAEAAPSGGGGGAAAPTAAVSDDPSGDDATATPAKLPTSLCGADSDDGGGGEDDSQLGSADRNKQRMDDAKDALAHLVGSDTGEDEPGPVAKALPVLSTRQAVVARSSRPAESSSDEEPSPAKATAIVSAAGLPSGPPALLATTDTKPAVADVSGSSSSDESEGGGYAAAHAAAVEREAAAWTGALMTEVDYHAQGVSAAAAAVPVASRGKSAPPPAFASTSAPAVPTAASAAAAATSVVPPPLPAVHPSSSTPKPSLPYVPHSERRVLAAYLRQALASASEQARGAVAAASAVTPVPVDSSAGVAAQGGPETKDKGGDTAVGGGAVDASHAVAISAAEVLGALNGLLLSVRHGRLSSPVAVVARVACILARAPTVFEPPLATGPAVASALTTLVRQVNRQRRHRRRDAVAAAHSVAVTSVEQAAADVAFRRRVTVDIHRAALLSSRPQWRALRRRTEAGTRAALASGGGCGVDWNREPPVCGLAGEVSPPSDSAFVFPEYGDVWNVVAPPPSLAAVREAQAADWRVGGDSVAGGGDADDDDWAPNGGPAPPAPFVATWIPLPECGVNVVVSFDLVAAGEDDAEDGGALFWLPSRGDDGPSPDGMPGHREHTALRSVVALLLYHGGFEDASLAALNALTDATSALFERVATSLSAARSAPASLPPPPVPQSPPSRLPSTMMVHPLQLPLQVPRVVRGAHVPARLRHTPPPPHPHTALSDVVSVTQRVLAASGNRGGLPEIATYRAASAARVESALRDSAMRLGFVSGRVSENRVRSSRAALAAAAGAADRADASVSVKMDAPPPAAGNVESLLAGCPGHARQAPGVGVAVAGGLLDGVANGTPQVAAGAAATGAAASPGSGTAGRNGSDCGAADAEDFPPAALLFGLFGPAAVVDILCLSRLGLGSASVPPHMAAWALAPFALQAPPPPPPPVPTVKAESDIPSDGGGVALGAGAPSPYVIDGTGPGGGLDADVAADLDGMDGVDFAGVANGLSIVNDGAAGASGSGPAGVLDMVDMDDDEDGAAAAAAVVLDELDVPLTALASVVNPVAGLSAGLTTAGSAGSAADAEGAPPTTPNQAATNGGGAEKSDGTGGHAGAEPSAVDYGLSWANAAGGDQDAERSVDQITALF